MQKSFLTIANFILLGSNYLLHVVVARLLENVELLGDYLVLSMVLTTITVIVLAGVPVLLGMIERDDYALIKKLLTLQGFIALLLTMYLFVFGDHIGLFINNEQLQETWKLLGVMILPAAIYGIFLSWSSMLGFYRISGEAILIFASIRFVTTGFLTETVGPGIVIWSFALASVGAGAYLVLRLRDQLPLVISSVMKPFAAVDASNVLGLVVFGFLLNLMVALDVYLLTNTEMSRYQLGQYTTYTTVGKVPFYLTTALFGFAWPEMNRKIGGQRLLYAYKLIAATAAFAIIWAIAMLFWYQDFASLLFNIEAEVSQKTILNYGIYITLFCSATWSWYLVNTVRSRMWVAGLMLVTLFGSLAGFYVGEATSQLEVIQLLFVMVLLSLLVANFASTKLRSGA